MKVLSILGSTGSIGESTLSVVRSNPGQFKIEGLSCGSNLEKLVEQIHEFTPSLVSVGEGLSDHLRELLKGVQKLPQIFEGEAGNIAIASASQVNQVVAAIVGASGIKPVMAAIRAEKEVALANKETIVVAGALMMAEARKRGVAITPIDSEHNAIFQSLQGSQPEDIESITLTASGGPFLKTPFSEFGAITREQALNHPNWSMGPKITIDSATMMNKCLEIIEARWLFDLTPEQIQVSVHPQSIVHSVVSYKDGSLICQMGVPDMRIPIACCLGYPRRIASGAPTLKLNDLASLTFQAPDLQKFPTIRFAYDVLSLGGGAPAVLNGANEALVGMFLEEKISFLQIFQTLQKVVNTLRGIKASGEVETDYKLLYQPKTIDDYIQADLWGRTYVALDLKRDQ